MLAEAGLPKPTDKMPSCACGKMKEFLIACVILHAVLQGSPYAGRGPNQENLVIPTAREASKQESAVVSSITKPWCLRIRTLRVAAQEILSIGRNYTNQSKSMAQRKI